MFFKLSENWHESPLMNSKHILFYSYPTNLWKKLFGGTVPPNNTQFGGTVPPNNTQFGGTVPPNNMQFGGTLRN